MIVCVLIIADKPFSNAVGCGDLRFVFGHLNSRGLHIFGEDDPGFRARGHGVPG